METRQPVGAGPVAVFSHLDRAVTAEMAAQGVRAEFDITIHWFSPWHGARERAVVPLN